MPPKGKLFNFKKNGASLKSATTYDASNDYAVIISGGYDDENNYIRYWNHCSALYSALVDVYNYSPSHIYVIMSDGTSSGEDRVLTVNPYTRDSSPLDLDGDGTNDIQYSATKSNISSVFNTLSNILDENDNLFVYTTDHGGQTSGNDVHLYLWGETMTDDEFATELDKVNAGKITVTMVQCHSGGFIDKLEDEGRIITTSCNADQNAHTLNWSYSEFTYHWISAIAGETPEGTSVDADDNNDGWISMREAYEYAENADNQPDETPQYNSTPNNLGCFVRLSDNWNWNISGPSLVCTNGSFSVNDVPTGATITWEDCSSTLSPPSSSTANPGVFSKNSNGSGWIDVSISNGCGTLDLPRTYVSVGTPTFYIDGPSTAPNNQWAYFTAQSQGGLADFDDFNWILSPLNGNSVYDYGHYCDIAFYNSGDYQLVGQAFNTCGWGDYTIKWIHVYDSYYMMVSPNPATTEATITIAPVTPEDASLKSATTQLTIDETAEWDIEVYSTMQSLKAKQTKIRGSSTKINTQSWKEGVYTIRAKYKDQILTGKLVVKK
jgi:hypothetical protein